MQVEHPEIILASASSARASILGSAGLRFHQRPSTLDEEAEHKTLNSGIDPSEIALRLARKKAEIIHAIEPNAIVLGADQVLAIGNEILQKPKSEGEARSQLERLRGRCHQLHSAAVILYQDKVRAFHDVAHLEMRDFSDKFLEWYLETVGEAVLTSVGAYHLEGLGIHLFSRIEGDYFTILGLPMTPILKELRALNVLLS